jgi:hypothetical protein
MCPKSLMQFLQNVGFNDKQMCPIPHNKTMLWNVPIEPSWNVRETCFLHKASNLNFGAKR